MGVDVECDEREYDEAEYEYGDYFEGDMELNDEQRAAIYGEKKVLNEHKYRWPHAIIPFILSKNYSAEEKKRF